MTGRGRRTKGRRVVIYVEGKSDVQVLEAWFGLARFTFEQADGGKVGVFEAVNRERARGKECFGIVDRDFATDEEVQASQKPDSPVAILRRYCIENYLLEPKVLSEVTQLKMFHGIDPQWWETWYTETLLYEWADTYANYWTANSLVNEWNRWRQQPGFWAYFQDLPPLNRQEILSHIEHWLSGLPDRQTLAAQFDAQHSIVLDEIQQLSGVHKWMNGKFVLYQVLAPLLERFCRAETLWERMVVATEFDPPEEIISIFGQTWVLHWK
jgi:hypothetical protein